jgi:hypothetical protein
VTHGGSSSHIYFFMSDHPCVIIIIFYIEYLKRLRDSETHQSFLIENWQNNKRLTKDSQRLMTLPPMIAFCKFQSGCIGIIRLLEFLISAQTTYTIGKTDAGFPLVGFLLVAVTDGQNPTHGLKRYPGY